MKTIHLTKIQFPEISLSVRDAHKLRGYFGNVFKDRSSLLHNHYETGALRYKYPLVQYKVLNSIPTLVAIDEGAQLLTELFMQMKELDINGRKYPILNKNISARKVEVGVSDDLHNYAFTTLWMALNQENHKVYRSANNQDQQTMLKKIAIGNILSFFKNMGLYLSPEERIMTTLQVEPHETKFKEQTMLAFSGRFTTNALLPEDVGIGKSVSRGFGTIVRN